MAVEVLTFGAFRAVTHLVFTNRFWRWTSWNCWGCGTFLRWFMVVLFRSNCLYL